MTPDEVREMYGTPADMDTTRIWGMHFKTASGLVISRTGDEAFWGTAEQADKVLAFTAKLMNDSGEDVVIETWRTDETNADR